MRARTLWSPALMSVGLVVVLGLTPARRRCGTCLSDCRPVSLSPRRKTSTRTRWLRSVRGAQTLLAVVSSQRTLFPMGKGENGSDAIYPYRYAALEPILDVAAKGVAAAAGVIGGAVLVALGII